MKVIFHLDLDSYFVSAERTINKNLINKPVVITNASRRSIVSAASYEAKKKGVYVPMPFFEAQQICPDIIAIKPNYALYTSLSSQFFEYLIKNITPAVEVASIDECYMDVTKLVSPKNPPLKIAQKIQQDVWADLKLPVSIGIADNKFVAKMSTQINKPRGITVTKPGEFLRTCGAWDIIKFHGIGAASAQKLQTLKINTISDLAKAKSELLKPIFGKNAEQYINLAKGIGDDIIDHNYNELKSIGNSETFQEKDLINRQDILDKLAFLCHKVAVRIHNRNLVGQVITLTLKYKGNHQMKLLSKQKKLIKAIYLYEDIFHQATALLDQLWDKTTIKHIGITLSHLSNMFTTTYQTSLFETAKLENTKEIIVRDINTKFKKKVVYLGYEQQHKDNKQQKQTRYLESDRILKHYDKK